ncbi:unnamed protein product, partial [Symbiodinium sp. CCMP2592]
APRLTSRRLGQLSCSSLLESAISTAMRSFLSEIEKHATDDEKAAWHKTVMETLGAVEKEAREKLSAENKLEKHQLLRRASTKSFGKGPRSDEDSENATPKLRSGTSKRRRGHVEEESDSDGPLSSLRQSSRRPRSSASHNFWEATNDSDMQQDRFKRRDSKSKAIDKIADDMPNSVEQYLDSELKTYFSMSSDRTLFLQVLEKDGIAHSCSAAKASIRELLQAVKDGYVPVQDMVGEESKAMLGNMSWVGRQSARRL